MLLFAPETGVNFTSPATSRYAVLSPIVAVGTMSRMSTFAAPLPGTVMRVFSSWTECVDPCGTTAETSKLILLEPWFLSLICFLSSKVAFLSTSSNPNESDDVCASPDAVTSVFAAANALANPVPPRLVR